MNNLEWAESFQIFAKYDDYHEVASEHDVIYAGPTPDDTSPEDAARLRELGWTVGEYECWEY